MVSLEADTNHSLPYAAPDRHKRSPRPSQAQPQASGRAGGELSSFLTPESAPAHTATRSAGSSEDGPSSLRTPLWGLGRFPQMTPHIPRKLSQFFTPTTPLSRTSNSFHRQANSAKQTLTLNDLLAPGDHQRGPSRETNARCTEGLRGLPGAPQPTRQLLAPAGALTSPGALANTRR